MNPIKSGALFVVEVTGDRLVREKHKLLDQLVGFVGRLFFDPVGFALGIEQDPQFGEIEVERALGEPLPTKRRSEVPGTLEKAVEIVLGGAAEAKERLRIGETVAGVDDGAGEAGRSGFAFGIEANESRVGEALFIGAEGAKAVREARRKHGDDTVDEIHAIGPFAGFVIQS